MDRLPVAWIFLGVQPPMGFRRQVSVCDALAQAKTTPQVSSNKGNASLFNFYICKKNNASWARLGLRPARLPRRQGRNHPACVAPGLPAWAPSFGAGKAESVHGKWNPGVLAPSPTRPWVG